MFGRERLQDFFLDPGVLHLNHGSYGALPRRVAGEQQALRDEAEARATTYNRGLYFKRLDGARGAVAELLGGQSEDWVFVDNATSACNAVILSQELYEGDEVLFLDATYGAVKKALWHWLQGRGVHLTEIPLRLPLAGPDEVIACVADHLSERVKLVVLDHITSPSALVMPVAEIAKMCKAAGARILVDGAHVPGHLPVDVPSLGVDYWCGNAHKWLFSPRSSGVLWVAPRHQADTHPTVLSHGTGQGFQAEFQWVGTRDASPWQSIPAGLRAHRSFGGAKLMARNRALAAEVSGMLEKELGIRPAGPSSMACAMVSLELPFAKGGDPVLLQKEFAERFQIETAFHPWNTGLCVRVSGQVYNEIADFEALGRAIRTYFDI